MEQFYGRKLEIDFVEALNHKYVFQLSPHLQKFIRVIFGKNYKFRYIRCSQTSECIKPDIIIQIGKEKRFVSLKCHNAEIVHTENIFQFARGLKDLKISENTLKIILLHHFGDGTLDGTGKIRYNGEQMLIMMEKLIKESNEELNSSGDMVEKLFDRILFQGINTNSQKIDYLYIGDVKKGYYASRREIAHSIRRDAWRNYQHLHIGPLIVRPNARYAHKRINDSERRLKTLVLWPHLKEDIKYIQEHYGSEKKPRY